MKKAICLILALVMVFGLVACGGNSSGTDSQNDTPSNQDTASGSSAGTTGQEDQEKIEQTQAESGVVLDYLVTVDESRKSTANSDEQLDSLTIIQRFDLTDVAPTALYRSEKTIALTGPVYEPLFRRVGVDEFVGVLAKEWDRTDSYMDVTIYDYIYDQDGNNITADDIIFSYDIYVDSGLAQQWTGYVNGYEKTGDYSVRFTFDQAVTGDPFRYSFCLVGIISEKAYNDHNGMTTDACGTGPYKVVDFTASAFVEIESTGDYWQTPELTDAFAKANVKNVHVDIITDSAQQLIALQSGKAAYCALDANTINDFLEGGRYAGQYALYSHLDPDCFGIMANQSEASLLHDKNMRLACFYAIDAASIVNMLGSSMYVQPNVNVSRVCADYNSAWDSIESYHNITDYDKVNEYLEAAGYDGQELVMIVEEHAAKKAIAEAAANMLEAAGIKCRLEVRAFALIDTELADETNWDLFICNGGGNGYASDRLRFDYSIVSGKKEGYTMNFRDDPEFQEKLATLLTPEGHSAELTDELMRYIIDEAFEISVAYAQAVTAYQPIFGNLKLRFGENKVMVTACDYYLD